ncbi:DUF4153 domain-containing protein [Clostridium sp. C2-6-12]|uniref:DUF4153 domain-containing protein n=1 Tax=Clostridium sp. C2-6-12 TaxID=2698832 RepID=UPI00136965E5|nr:DUF4153 domain-containing protein [Clostridium sp. C2-6-12]
MKSIDKLQKTLSGLCEAISRYPLTLIFLIAAATVNSMGIQRGEPYTKEILTFVIGAFLGFTVQAAYERFYEKFMHRVILMGISIFFTLGYFLVINQSVTTSLETWIRTSVALFALLIAYMWVPVIKSHVTFNESFMAAFKAFFNSFLFSLILFIGISLILTAIDLLLFSVNEKSYMHSLNIVGVIFAPIYFLSLIPIYPGLQNKSLLKRDFNANNDNIQFNKEIIKYNEENILKASSCPRFLEILISYIIIPLLSVYTAILIIYIIKNINTKFWSDNKLEPMLVGFAITVILLYILASRLENKFATVFRKFFPKILVPIVLFQILSSILRIQSTGITHERYYVILFGIFAVLCGIFLSILPVRKNGIIAILLIGFSLFSIIPPVDAFTISRTNQQKKLESILAKNNMLIDNKITPNPSISDEDKKVISTTLNYLEMMGCTKKIKYLGKDFNSYRDFYTTFGFYRYEDNIYRQDNIYISLNRQLPINVSGYDTLVQTDFYIAKDNTNSNNKLCNFEKAGHNYTLSINYSLNSSDLWLSNDRNEELMRIHIKDVFEKFHTSVSGNYPESKNSITPEQATFTQENDKAIISLIALNINIEKSNIDYPYNGEFYILVKIK